MDEANNNTPGMSGAIQQQSSQTLGQNGSPLDDTAKDELPPPILTTLEAFPFKDEMQKTSFFEKARRLEKYHVIQVFNLGVVPLQNYLKDSPEFLDEVIKLFEICFSFCYTADLTKIVPFDYYAKALKFCFPPQPKQCLSTELVSTLLELVLIFQEGKLASIVSENTTQVANLQVENSGTRNFFDELLKIFENRREGGCIKELIDETMKYASADAEISFIVEPVALGSNHIVLPVLLTNWMRLLKLEHVSNGFASAIATMDARRCTKQSVPFSPPILPGIGFQVRNHVYESTVLDFVSILEQMKRRGSEVTLPADEERLDIFFKRINQFLHHSDMMETFLKLLENTTISNKVLEEILDQFCCKGKRPAQLVSPSMAANVQKKAEAFDLLFKVLLLFPDEKLIEKVLKFWTKTFSVDADYQHLPRLMMLFVEGSSREDRCFLEERAERILKFLEGLPPSVLSLLVFWQPFLSCFIKLFPTSFQRRPEVSAFIHKASEISKVPAEERQAHINVEQTPPLRFLEWISQQSLSEETRNEMIGLLKCCIDGGRLGHNWEFSINAIKQLSLCHLLPFSEKQGLLQELNYLAKQFKEQEKMVFQEFVEGVASNGSLDLKDEIVSEILGFVKRFIDKYRPMRTIPSNVLQLLSLVSATPISGDRRVKLLQKSKESSKGLLNSIRILELTKLYCLKEGANEYFDLLYHVFVDAFKEEARMCEQFYKQQRQHSCSFQALKVWILEVKKLISLGSFNEEVDFWCCLAVLHEASGMSESEMSQLFSQVRTSAEQIVKDQKQSHSFPDLPGCVPPSFRPSIVHVVRSIVFSGEERLLLVKKVCNIFLSGSAILTEQSMRNVLNNLIPVPSSQNSNSSNKVEAVHLESGQIVAMLGNPRMLAQLSRIPAEINRSLCSVLSTMNCDSFSRERLENIYCFIASQNDLHEVFFIHFLSVLEVIMQEAKSVQDVLDILRELGCMIHPITSDLLFLIMFSFEHLVQNHVSAQERKRFIKEVVMKWSFSPDTCVLTYLKVPQLLWKIYTSTDCSVKRCQLVDRVQEILKETNERVESYSKVYVEPQYENIRGISCCELEWLVFHSSLPNYEAALAYNLCFRCLDPRIRCFKLSGVQIEESRLVFQPQEISSQQVANRYNMLTPCIATMTAASDPQAIESHSSILTPVYIAQEMIQRLKHVLGQMEDLAEIASSLWDIVFSSTVTSLSCETECAASFSFRDEYVHIFLSILAEASSKEISIYWAKQNWHHVSQCSEVILKACKKTGERLDMDTKACLNFHTVVYNTMETVRTVPFAMGIPQPVPCYRHLKPELQQLSSMIGSSLPIRVTLEALKLFRVNFHAGVTVCRVVSSCSCEQQAVELIQSVKLYCQREEMSSLNAAQTEFVWQLAEAFGRLYRNSCRDLVVRLKELTVLYDPEDAYGFNRLPKWRQRMIEDNFSVHAIDCWCVAFLMTPLEDVTSRDVDAIVNLDSDSLKLVSSVSQDIKTCIFPEEGFQVTQREGIKESQTKERLRLARLLGEFIYVLKQRKPEENPKDAVIREIVVDACDELCRTHLKKNRRRNDLYKIHGQKLKALFTEVFGKQRKTHHEAECVGMVKQQADEGQIRAPSSVTRQSSYLHENLPRVLNHTDVYEPLLVLLRRWLSGIAIKPVLASHTREVVQRLFSFHSSEVSPVQLKQLHGTIQAHVLSLENNQALIANLQAAGYNHGRQDSLNLWSSPSVECAGYLSKTESADSRRFEKKLTEVLRRLWNEWKNILLFLFVASIKVGEAKVCTKDLFGFQDSLKEMEEQVSAVKEMLSQMKLENPNLARRVEELMRQEQRHRARIKKLYKSKKVRNG